jgi:hypothetical protein
MTDAEVLGHRCCFPDNPFVGALRLYSLTLQLQSTARLNTRCVARKAVNSPVFLVGDGHAVFPGVDTTRNRRLLGLMNQNDYQYRSGRSRRHNSDHNFRGGGLKAGICPSGRCQCQTEDDDQNSAPERFPGQAVLIFDTPRPSFSTIREASGLTYHCEKILFLKNRKVKESVKFAVESGRFLA